MRISQTPVSRAVNRALEARRVRICASTVSAIAVAAMTGTAIAGFPPAISFSDLDGENGFAGRGAAADDFVGEWTVSGAGDINGDGIDDVIMGAYRARPNGSYSGQAYVVFGDADRFDPALELASLDGSNGFIINGSMSGDSLGTSVSDAGDINGDGFDDVIVGAPRVYENGLRVGKSYILFGKNAAQQGDFEPVIDAESLGGRDGFALKGIAADNLSGWSVSAAGDINNDGVDDVITASIAGGITYVFFGRDTAVEGDFPDTFDLTALNGTNGFSFVNTSSFGKTVVSEAGDVNGDGIGDVIIGVSGASPQGRRWAGQTYVIFGRDTASSGDFPATLEPSDLNGQNGFALDGENVYDGSGYSVSWAGDVNGDGIDDVVLGAWETDTNGSDAGSSYVVFGSREPFPPSLELSALDGSNGFVILGREDDMSGWSVGGGEDVNLDGVHDIIVGAPQSLDSGRSFVVFGRDTGQAGDFPAAIKSQELNGKNGFVANGIRPSDLAGSSVSAAGDVNGDGVGDFMVGAMRADEDGLADTGEVYVVFGGGFRAFEPVLATLGDINGDTRQDIAALKYRPLENEVTAVVKDVSGATLGEISFDPDFRPVSMESLADVNNNGSRELAVLGRNRMTDQVRIEIRDALTGEMIGTVGYGNKTPLFLSQVADLTGDTFPELAVLLESSVLAKIKDPVTGSFVGNVAFNPNFTPRDFLSSPDLDNSGAPELIVLGRDANGNSKAEIRDTRSGRRINTIWYGRRLVVQQLAFVPDFDSSGVPVLAALRTNSANRVSINDVLTDELRGSIRFNPKYQPSRLLVLPDFTGNGVAELALFGTHKTSGLLKAEVRDGLNASVLQNVWFDKRFRTQDVGMIQDINGNNAPELVMLGRNTDKVKLRAFVKDAKTNASLAQIDF